MPRDPQGAGTRKERQSYWRNVYPNRTAGQYTSREQADYGAFPDRIAVEEVTTVTTITRHPIPPQAVTEAKPRKLVWSVVGHGQEVLSDETGLIVGSVEQRYHAAVAYGTHGKLGSYVSLDLAKQAVLADCQRIVETARRASGREG